MELQNSWPVGWSVVAALMLVVTILIGTGLVWTTHPITVTAVATVFLAAGVLVALVGLEDARRTRHAQIVTDLSARWDSHESLDSQRAFILTGRAAIERLIDRLYDTNTPRTLRELDSDYDLFSRLLALPNLIETIGVLHRTKIVSTEVVYMLWGAGVITWWRRWQPLIEKIRAFNDQPSTSKYFEQLALDMEEYGRLQGDTFPA